MPSDEWPFDGRYLIPGVNDTWNCFQKKFRGKTVTAAEWREEKAKLFAHYISIFPFGQIQTADDQERSFHCMDISCIFAHFLNFRKGSALSQKQVMEIFRSRDVGRKARLGALFARSYGVSAKTIRDIWNGSTWIETTQDFGTLATSNSTHSGLENKNVLPTCVPEQQSSAHFPALYRAENSGASSGVLLRQPKRDFDEFEEKQAMHENKSGVGDSSSSSMCWHFPALARTPPRRFWGFDYNIRPIVDMFNAVPSISDAVERTLLQSDEIQPNSQDAADHDYSHHPVFEFNAAQIEVMQDSAQVETSSKTLETSFADKECSAKNSSEDHEYTGKTLYEDVVHSAAITSFDDKAITEDVKYGFLKVNLSRSGSSLPFGSNLPFTWDDVLALQTIKEHPSDAFSKTDTSYVVPLIEIDLFRLMLFDLLHPNTASIRRFLRLWSGVGDADRGVLVEWCTESISSKVRSSLWVYGKCE